MQQRAPRLALALLHYEGEEALVAIPTSMTMGWVNSPPTFSAVSETITDLANHRMYRRHAAPHRLEHLAEAHDLTDEDPVLDPTVHDHSPDSPEPPHSRALCAARELPPPLPQPRAVPSQQQLEDALAYADVFVDDFIGLSQGNQHRRKIVRRHILHSIDLHA